MNLKELIKEVESIKKLKIIDAEKIWYMFGIKQTVEAIDKDVFTYVIPDTLNKKDWKKLKGLLGIK